MMKNIRNIFLTLAITGCSFGISAKMPVRQTQSPSPEWMNNAIIYEANLRQGTASRDLQGLRKELPRLKELGVDIVWLMPIHPISEKNRKGGLGSYYAVRDYKAVNPEFGTMKDLKELVADAHELGMKVILDEVCNHTGCDNPWVTDHPEYYARNEKGEMYGPFDWTDTYKLDYSNPATREAMSDVLQYWIKEADIDGYRCDVAGEVPTDFWEEVRPKLEKIKPVFMLAESSKPELLRKAFDADYAWPMKDVFNAIANTKGVNSYAKTHGQKLPEMNAQNIPALLKQQKSDYPYGSVHMNMITNHDLNSWEGTEFDRYGDGAKAFAVLSYTLPGMNMLYTGQEVGFDHPFEFFEQDNVQPDYTRNEYTRFYEKLNAVKHLNKALAASEPLHHTNFIESENPDVLTFTRQNGRDKVLVIVNLSDKKSRVHYLRREPYMVEMTDIFSGSEKLPEIIEPWGYYVFTSRLRP